MEKKTALNLRFCIKQALSSALIAGSMIACVQAKPTPDPAHSGFKAWYLMQSPYSAEQTDEESQPGYMWGQSAIHADSAHQQGFHGAGVKVGILDSAVAYFHPAFTGRLTVLGDPDDLSFEDANRTILDAHGTHVAGIIGAERDSRQPMYGVAYQSELVTAKLLDSANPKYHHLYYEELLSSGIRILNNSWGISLRDTDDQGNIIYPHIDTNEIIQALLEDKDKIEQLSDNPIDPLGGLDNYNTLAGTLRLTREGVLMVFAAGNEQNYNEPFFHQALGFIFPEIAPNMLVVTNLQPDLTLDNSSTRCGYTALYCVSAPGTHILSSIGYTPDDGNGELQSGYQYMSGTSMAAPMVSGAAAVLMQRFPYMTADQIATVLKTTATDLGDPGLDEEYGWGLINLGAALQGPKQFITEDDIPEALRIDGGYGPEQFVAYIPGVGSILEAGTPRERVCDTTLCGTDTWTHDITGHGGLVKRGSGLLQLTGNSSYSGATDINGGWLAVEGAISSDVTVNRSGGLTGAGSLGTLTVNEGGWVSPGSTLVGQQLDQNLARMNATPNLGKDSYNTIGTLQINGDVTFNLGSTYLVHVTPYGASDLLNASGSAFLNGGQVSLALEGQSDLLSRTQVESILGIDYLFLTAQQGITGTFSQMAPDYLFIDGALSYQDNSVVLSLIRNDKPISDVVQDEDKKEAATAIDNLLGDNPLKESILLLKSEGELEYALRQLMGQIHSDIAAEQISNSHILRDSVNARLRQNLGLNPQQEIKTSQDKQVWGQMLGNWSHLSSQTDQSGYRASTYGVIFGSDLVQRETWQLGSAMGFTRTKLNNDLNSTGHSDNYHVALYAGKQKDALALRAGLASSWHRIDTSRSIAFNHVSDKLKAHYQAHTHQAFAEAGYTFTVQPVAIEPFANLAYMNYRHNGFSEKGGAAALRSKAQNQQVTFSTLGARVGTTWDIGEKKTLSLNTELGWQHKYGTQDQRLEMTFKSGQTPFEVETSGVAQNSGVVKVNTELALPRNVSLYAGYQGILSQQHQSNSLNAGLNWRF